MKRKTVLCVITIIISTLIIIWWVNAHKEPGLAEQLDMTLVFLILALAVIYLIATLYNRFMKRK